LQTISEKNNNADHDIQLLADVGNGDKKALSILYDRYASHVLAVTFHILKNKPEAEDLVHDVFIEAWQKALNYDASKGTVRNWLLLRARSRAIDRIRKLARVETRSDIEESEVEFSGDNSDISQFQDHQQAREAINMLSPDHALLIRASYFEDLTYREISKKYEIPEGTVKSRMLAAFKVLRKQLLLNREDELIGVKNG